MCKICAEAVERLFPEFTNDEKMDILWNETAYPFADGPHTERQLIDFARSIVPREAAD